MMRADKFTKIVLTVIAINLTALTVTTLDLIPKAYAGSPSNSDLRPTANYGLVPLNEDGTISVKLSPYDRIDVNIVGISTMDELDVNIEEIGGAFVSRGGPILVEISE